MIAESNNFVAARKGGERRRVRVALLGCGTVGGAVARLLTESRKRLRDSYDIDIEMTRILVRDARKQRAGIDPSLLTADFEQVLRDEPDVFIEALGGREPAATFVKQALERGISVVSANKTLIAHDGQKLEAIARESDAQLAFEASVGAAIPVLAALRQRAGDPIVSLRGVLNGTCNFVLSRMRETGSSLDVVLQEAIERGFAEPDPTADISGRDTAEKLCVLARAAGFASVTLADIPTSGIENVTPRDLDAAREQGCVVRLIAELETGVDGIAPPRLRVGPAFVPVAHPLAKARGAENVIVLDQEFAGRLVLQGEGAGPKPTAAAILGDLLNVLGATARVASRAAPAAVIDSPAPVRQSFVRLPRAHEATASLRRLATQVHVRRDAIEMVLSESSAINAHEGFVAAVLD